MLYTIVSINDIFTLDNTKYDFVKIKGGFLQVEKNKDDYVLNRIISTDPKDFLNSQYKIGQAIDYPFTLNRLEDKTFNG